MTCAYKGGCGCHVEEGWMSCCTECDAESHRKCVVCGYPHWQHDEGDPRACDTFVPVVTIEGDESR